MFSLSNTVFDRTATLQRLPNPLDDTDWGGDAIDDYSNLETDISCRVEMTDIDTWTVWFPSSTTEPHWHDKILVDGLDLELYIIRVKPWTALDGTSHHYELTATDKLETRKFADER